MEILDTELGYTNVIMLLIDGNTPRQVQQRPIRHVEADVVHLRGDLVGLDDGGGQQAAIDERQPKCDFYGDPSEYCKNEDWFKRELTAQLRE